MCKYKKSIEVYELHIQLMWYNGFYSFILSKYLCENVITISAIQLLQLNY